MTNAELILANTATLVANGVIKETDIIHTYGYWMSQHQLFVKHGEHAVAKFSIWKFAKGRKKAADEEGLTEEEAIGRGYCFLATAAWFTQDQVCTREEYIKLFGFDPINRKKRSIA